MTVNSEPSDPSESGYLPFNSLLIKLSQIKSNAWGCEKGEHFQAQSLSARAEM